MLAAWTAFVLISASATLVTDMKRPYKAHRRPDREWLKDRAFGFTDSLVEELRNQVIDQELLFPKLLFSYLLGGNTILSLVEGPRWITAYVPGGRCPVLHNSGTDPSSSESEDIQRCEEENFFARHFKRYQF